MSISVVQRQAGRFVLVGLATNTALYLAYCLLTELGGSPKPVMTLLYLLGVAMSFIANRRWTFGAGNAPLGAFGRYLALQFVGYALNYAGLSYGTDHLALDHRLVQAVMIAIVATCLFVGQRYWVFAAVLPRERTT